MVIENSMYFLLGFLAAALLALMIVPSIWQRAVRLTKKRIEAATPMTMSEYRADKDQLRAEFALSTRRLEMNVEALRKRLADQIAEVNRKKSEQAQLRADRDEQLVIVRELEEREAQLRRRILDLEKEGTDLAQRLRMKDRDLDRKVAELERYRNAGGAISADEIDELLGALERERARSERYEEQVHSLISQMEAHDSETAAAHLQISELRRNLADRDDRIDSESTSLMEAEARIASAESRLTALLEETHSMVEIEETKNGQLLAEKLSLEEELENLREKIVGVESAILNEWDDERVEQSHLRERLNDIASDVSRLVFSVDEEAGEAEGASLFDRVRRFADNLEDEGTGDHLDLADVTEESGEGGRLSERMQALKDLHAR
ncbi:MAG: hypothetical protein KDJ19_11210 [Hyphomicrobiaceae bacterium]|nr:hypothetical protein [Hyphomicrobiaceae bacterium]MCC0024209.1 hypothetical protein [Hyphomicrobiaceae bacterium]